MTESSNNTPTKKSAQVIEQIMATIRTAAAQATPEDRATVAALIAKAKEGQRDVGIYTLNPACCAIIFIEHNPHNRDWRADGPRSCREYARRMTETEWSWNGAALAFYADGALSDGQHRASAAALARYTMTCIIAFGVERKAIATIDDIAVRQAADAAKLDGIKNATTKQAIVNSAASYDKKVGDTNAQLRSNQQRTDAIKTNDELLTQAIDIGAKSTSNSVNPVLKLVNAQTLAYIMLRWGWPLQRVREKLALFQSGSKTEDSDKSPYFVAGEVIRNAQTRRDAKDKLSTVKEIGVALYAMIETERGTKAISASTIRAAVKKGLPDPTYPADDMKTAA